MTGCPTGSATWLDIWVVMTMIDGLSHRSAKWVNLTLQILVYCSVQQCKSRELGSRKTFTPTKVPKEANVIPVEQWKRGLEQIRKTIRRSFQRPSKKQPTRKWLILLRRKLAWQKSSTNEFTVVTTATRSFQKVKAIRPDKYRVSWLDVKVIQQSLTLQAIYNMQLPRFTSDK